MKFAKISLCSMFCALGAIPIAANSATYYNGGVYQQQQQQAAAARAAAQSAAPRYVVPGSQTAGYYVPNQSPVQRAGAVQQRPGQSPVRVAQPAPQTGDCCSHKGFYASAGASYESAVWEFSMKNAGSILSYNNVVWTTFDLNAGYGFDVGDFGLKVDLGLKFGMQNGTSGMTDDDISAGGYFINFFYEPGPGNTTGIFNPDTDTFLGNVYGRALSIGKSSGGSMFGYNLGIGLTDKFQFGNVRVTPAIGWRNLTYKLKTNNNNGLAMEVIENTSNCVMVPGKDEMQCGPAIIINNGGTLQLVWHGQATSGGVIDTGGTYFYSQPGTSHSYEVEWAGPYIAFDFDYFINVNNAVNARLELGLPSYTATGDQPYRPDWRHPKSVEDKAGMGSAFHVGLGANWMTAITDTVQLSIGLMYDYYTVSGADAKTFLNGTYYTDLLNFFTGVANGTITQDANGNAFTAADRNNAANNANGIAFLQQECPGWVCKDSSEVDSFYRSVGIRVGVAAQF